MFFSFASHGCWVHLHLPHLGWGGLGPCLPWRNAVGERGGRAFVCSRAGSKQQFRASAFTFLEKRSDLGVATPVTPCIRRVLLCRLWKCSHYRSWNAVISLKGEPVRLEPSLSRETLCKSRQDNAGQLILDFHLWPMYLSASWNQRKCLCCRLLVLERLWWLIWQMFFVCW